MSNNHGGKRTGSGNKPGVPLKDPALKKLKVISIRPAPDVYRVIKSQSCQVRFIEALVREWVLSQDPEHQAIINRDSCKDKVPPNRGFVPKIDLES